jgi:RHS repeat-associated protein
LGAWNAQPWQQYRYNGKERDTLTGWYEYGFRWYIDGIGRFTGVDPIADQFAWVSVYNYAENSPIGNIDLHGLQAAGYEIATRRDDIALMKGQMSRDEYVARQQARGQGAIAGMGLGILFVGGKAALVGAGQWVLRNPVAATEMAKTAGGVIRGMTTEQEMPGNLDNTGRVMKAGAKAAVQEIGTLRNFDQVAGYVRKNRKLPSNFITKEEATSLGWKPKLGNLDAVAPGKSIGGDIFKNKEGLLPEKSGRVWYEADINYTGGFRSSDRLLYSNDGLLYKTTDHYKTFEPIKTK